MKNRLLPIIVVSVFFVIAWQQQNLADWWFLRNYQPSNELVALAEDSYMNENGKRLFYLSDPQINTKKEFNQNCPVVEESFVLGCYANRKIHVLEVDRPELEGIMEVTAAHEMLHAAYERLDESERRQIVSKLETVYEDTDDEILIDLIERYESRGGDTIRQNELHSILPTQVVDLPEPLEEYYARYFTDRQAVAQMYEDYEGVFAETKNRITQIKDDLASVKSQINTLESQISTARESITNLNQRLDRLERSGETEAYNALVPEQNDAVSRYNSLVNQHRSQINRYNQLAEEINKTILYQADLVNSIDSTYQSL